MTKEVLELALAELLECRSVDDNERGRHIAITAIEEELAQPEQEPVAWEQFYPDIGKPKFVAQPDQELVAIRLWDSQWMNVVNHDNCYQGWDKEDAINHAVKMTEKYIAENFANNTTPPQRKPLPYEQLDSLWQTTDTGDFELDIREFARAIEAAHNIKE